MRPARKRQAWPFGSNLWVGFQDRQEWEAENVTFGRANSAGYCTADFSRARLKDLLCGNPASVIDLMRISWDRKNLPPGYCFLYTGGM